MKVHLGGDKHEVLIDTVENTAVHGHHLPPAAPDAHSEVEA
jgi:hypothetical protein